MRKLLGHLICLVVFSSVLALCMEKFLEFVPFFAMGIVMLLPFYGLFTLKNQKVRYVGKFLLKILSVIKDIHLLSKKSLFYWACLFLAFMLNFNYLIDSVGKTIVYSFVGFGGMFLFWGFMRWVLMTFFSIEIPKCLECVKSVFQSA